MEAMTRQMRKRAAFTVALNRMPTRERVNERLSIPVTRKRRRAMARIVARRVVGENGQ